MDYYSKCMECGCVFNNLKDYSTHVIKNHFNSKRVKSTKKIVTKQIKKEPKKKIAKKIERKTVFCKECQKSYCSTASYNTHRNKFHTTKEPIKLRSRANRDVLEKQLPTELIENELTTDEEKNELTEQEIEKLHCNKCQILTSAYSVFVTDEKSSTKIRMLLPTVHGDIKLILCNSCLLYTLNPLSIHPKIKSEKSNVKIEKDEQTSNYSEQDDVKIKIEKDSSDNDSTCSIKEEAVSNTIVNEIPEEHKEVFETMAINVPSNKFNCIFCKTSCGRNDHFEINKWYAPNLTGD